MIPHGVRRVLPDVSRETETRLERFEALFAAWTARINLVAPGSEDLFWTRHVADSAQLLRIKPDARRWVDLGSGAGFPGLVVAIAISQYAEGRVDLIESNRKKAAFLKAVRAECAPCAVIHAERIETAVPHLAAPQIVTARALSPLADLLAMVEPWLADSTIALFHKGRGYGAELEDSRAHWDFDLVEHPSLTAPDSVILEIGRVRRKVRGGQQMNTTGQIDR